MTTTQTYADLTAFRRDIIVAVIRKGGAPDNKPFRAPYGLAIKRELEDLRGEEVNHGRLYPNLDDLIGLGLLTKHEKDKRTNGYQATDDAVDALTNYYADYIGVVVDVDAIEAKGAETPAPADD